MHAILEIPRLDSIESHLCFVVCERELIGHDADPVLQGLAIARRAKLEEPLLEIIEPLLWRRQGWVRVRVNIAGVGGEDSGGNKEETLLIPVASRASASRRRPASPRPWKKYGLVRPDFSVKLPNLST